MTSTVRRDPATDEEFLAQLYKGGELLAAGKVNEAKDHLERAYQLHPKNEKAQNLLGLTYFKLGLFERASEIYELLVNDNPADPTLRVNLGLVYLKTNNLMRSVREFETATDLEPGHKKAHNYLGLALAQAGDYARAREHFVISGSEAMADKMARAMVSATAPLTVKMTPPPSSPTPGQPEVPAPAVTAPPPAALPEPRSEEVQIEMMSDEEDVPPEADSPPPMEAPSATTLVSQAQSMGGADGPPLPQPGFEEMPDPKVPPIHADWGAQFGVDPPSKNGSKNVQTPVEELQMASDEGPSAATSEAAVATGMQVPATVMVDASSDEMPLVDSADVIEATVEEVSDGPVVMVEQNVLVPVDDDGAITEQPMPADVEAVPVGEESWTTAPPELEQYSGEASGEPVMATAESELLTPQGNEGEQTFTGRVPTAEQRYQAELLGAEDTMSSPRAITRPVLTAEEEFTGTAAPQEYAPEEAAVGEQSVGGESPYEGRESAPSFVRGEEEISEAEREFTAHIHSPTVEEMPDGVSENSYAEGVPENSYVEETAPSEVSSTSYSDAPPISDAEREFTAHLEQPAVEEAPPPEPPPSLPAWVTGPSAPTPEPEPEWAEPAPINSYEAAQEAEVSSPPPELQPGFQAIAVPKLADLGPRLDYGASTASGPFHVGPEGLAVTVKGEMLCRLMGLVAVAGGVDAQPESKRNRGRAIEQPFGEGAAQLQRVKGHGTLYLEPGRAHFQAIDLDDEGCYLREEKVFAFEEAVAFENGRLTAGQIGVEMVHLKGHGAVLLKLEGSLKAMAVPPGTPLKVPLARLVGWYGQVSPRVMVGFVGQATVELTGDGYALLAAHG